jgi:hypothetical protein
VADITGIPLADRVLIVGLSQIVVAAILAILTINLYTRFRERRLPATKDLTLVSLFLALASFMQVLIANTLEPILGVSSLGWGLAFGLTAIANIFLYAFMLEIFSEGRSSGGTWFKLFVVVEACIAVLLPIVAPLSNIISIFEALLLLVLVIHLSFSFSLYITLARWTTTSIRKTSDATARRGFSLIRLAAFTIIIAFSLFVLDRVWQIFLEPEGYTIWVILGWIMSGVGGILLYSGFVLPRRIRGTKQS